MSNEVRPRGVQLEAGATASQLLGRLLEEAQRQFEPLHRVRIDTERGGFKRSYGDALVEFEAARVRSPVRSEIAKFLAERAAAQLYWSDGEGHELPLREHLASPSEPLETKSVSSPSDVKLIPQVPWEGEARQNGQLLALIEEMNEKRWITDAGAKALRWVIGHADEHGGHIDLSGHKFVLLGAGAELAPTRLLLRGGAEVLWIDIHDPAEVLGSLDDLGGTLTWCPQGANLLTQPAEILATMRKFAGDGGLHVGMFAYRPGKGREWRLEGTMNALVAALEPERVRSISFYVSPTSAHVVQPEDVAAARERRHRSPMWQRMLRRTGLLKPPHYTDADVSVARALVPLQGTSYQAAQYVAKLMSAEAFATQNSGRPIPRVSANVAGITNTESMAQPVFQAGFAGAPMFGVKIFDPATTRALAGLLLLHDLLHPEGPTKDPSGLFSRQIHGGVFAMSDALDGAIRVAALDGIRRKPGLLKNVFRP